MRVPLKPVQAECRRCEKLFCFFQRTIPRVYCAPCVELERLDLLKFRAEQRRKQAVLAAHEARSMRPLLRFANEELFSDA